MNRRRFLNRSALTLGTSMLAADRGLGEIPSTGASPPPNIIFILTDDQRWDTLGCAGNGIIETPVLDSLAARGARFSNAFVTSPACAPNRACLFTSLHERTHRFTFGSPPLQKVFSDLELSDQDLEKLAQ